jgi:hypothetical protein
MNFTSYADFRSRVQRVMDGDDAASSLSVGLVNDIISLAESRIYRETRNYLTEDSFSAASITAGVVTLPTDLVAIKIAYVNENVPVEFIPEEQLEPRLRGLSLENDDTIYAAQAGNTLKIWPTATSGSLSGRYYRRFTDLSTTFPNAFFTKYPDLFFFATLAEGSVILGDPRGAAWEAKYQNIKSRVNNERNAAYEGSRLQVRLR